MANPIGGESFSPTVLWNIIALAVPIVTAVVIATYKILNVLRKEIRGELAPVMSRIDTMEKRFLEFFRAIWDHDASQDIKIEAVTNAHNRLRGAHDAIVQMGGHQGYSGPERRKEARPPKCPG